MRPVLLTLACLVLPGCALPSLPKLPKLPGPSDVAAILPVGSSGQSLKEAVALAMPVADNWAANASWVSLLGNKLDPGGRNGGYQEGAWIFTFQSPNKIEALEVRVSQGLAVQRSITKKDYPDQPLKRDVSGLIDSTDAVTKSGLSAKSLTIVLRQDGDNAVYNLVEEGGVARAVLDAKTGEKRDE
jgi:hypothetical protein